jgi:hypothetical protein
MQAPRVSLFGVFVFLLGVSFPGTREVHALTVDDYEATQIEGWTVRVEKSLTGDPRREQALGLLQSKLANVRRALPGKVIPKLQQVTIWLSRDVAPGAAYHPSAGWLEANGRVVEMAEGIEIMNVDDFLEWSEHQPWLILHELAHAYHHRFLPGGDNYPLILSAYQKAVKTGDYKRVLYYNGTKMKAYALNNPMEFFAESTEAYFGRNDFQPFNRRQLKGFDRVAYRMVEKAWGVQSR